MVGVVQHVVMSKTSVRTFGGGPPLSEEALRTLERRHGLVLPPRYRAFLAEANGGRPERDIFFARQALLVVRVRFFYGLESSVLPCNLGWIRETLTDRLPADLLAIATTDRADRLCISTTRKHLVLWEPPDSFVAITDSFEEYLEGVYRDAESPTATSSIWPIRFSRE